jgi:outer membrane lipoprotein-sorting protein
VTRRIVVRSLTFLAIALMTVATLAQVRPSQFSADMKSTGKGMTVTGKLYFGGPKTRMEMTTQGHQSIMITDAQRKVTYMLMVDRHMYMEMSTEAKGPRKNPDWRTYDPANPCANMADTTCERLGPGVADGRLCDKWKFSNNKNGTSHTTWIDLKTGIPIRTETSEGTVMELTNIKEGAQSASLFEIPAGYTKMDMGAMMQGVQGRNK